MNGEPCIVRKDNIDSELYHYGVKGMKWGVRKFSKRKERYRKWNDSLNKNYDEKHRRMDRFSYGRKAVERISKRMDEGTPYSKARARETGRKAAITTLSVIGSIALKQYMNQKAK